MLKAPKGRRKKPLSHITEEQVHHFAGNMLQVKGANESKYMIMSKTARDSLALDQFKKIEAHAQILRL